MHQPLPSAKYNPPRINVNGAQLKNVENFANLGSPLSRNTRIDDEVAQRISKASQAFAGCSLRVELNTGKKSLKQLQINPATWEDLA
ncbi:unnamed protein product [Schistocephalus solidus]|uniref:Flg_hook domain-containing protein n=1 Tax=Schistocephalus solidus TaxID=70667 RepID=A0A183SP05_SCHSO|nr:unnamed protein product [Schistocephalus solidus]